MELCLLSIVLQDNPSRPRRFEAQELVSLQYLLRPSKLATSLNFPANEN